MEVLTWRNIYQEQKLIKNGGDMIKLWRDIRETTPNIRKIDKKLLDWQEQNRHEDAISAQNFENTDEALKLYNKFHPDENMQINEPVFSDYYRPSKEQKIGEMAYVSGGMMVLVMRRVDGYKIHKDSRL